MTIRIVPLVFFLAVASAAWAQDSLHVLTFKQAVQTALRNNLTLNQTRNTLFQTQTQKTSGIAQLGPQVGISAGASQSTGNRFIQSLGERAMATSQNLNATLNAQMPIFNGFQYVNNMRSNNQAHNAQIEAVKRSNQDVINLVSTQYLQVLLDQELLIIAKENVDVLRKQLDQIKAHVELGSRSPVDEYNQQALVNNAEIQMVQAEYTLVNDKITLYQTMMVEPSNDSRFEEPAWDINAMALDSISLMQLQGIASEHRADLKQFRYTELSSRYSMQSAKGIYFPSINAYYNYGSAYADVEGQQLSDFKTQVKVENKFETFGVQLNIPIFTAFQTRATYARWKVAYQNSQLNTKNQEVVVKSDVLRAFENFNNVKKSYAASSNGLEASQVAFNLEQERYNLGITSFVDLANANRTLVQAQTNMAQAKYRFLFQKIMLDYATGTLKLEDIP